LILGEKFRLCDFGKKKDPDDDGVLECMKFKIQSNKETKFVDIGMLRKDSADNRVVVFYPKGECLFEFCYIDVTVDCRKSNVSYFIVIGGVSCQVPTTSRRREPMSYSLLFSRGEHGWGINNESIFGGIKLRFPTYLASRLLRNESLQAFSLLDPTYELLTNRFQVMAHLGQMYTVDAVSCMIDTKLKFSRNNQDMITGARREDVQKEDKSKFFAAIYMMVLLLLFRGSYILFQYFFNIYMMVLLLLFRGDANCTKICNRQS
jgi:hypothetical protein